MDQQKRRTSDPEYLAEVQRMLDERGEDETAPSITYRFNQLYASRFGETEDFAAIKREYNDIVLGLEPRLRERIAAAEDPLAAALIIARLGNYIDFGAMAEVSPEAFLALFDDISMRPDELAVYHSFLENCARAERFLLVADNCGEIVLDRLMLEELRRRFPQLSVKLLVRGAEVLNDATAEDAVYAGADRVAEIVSSGVAIPGTMYALIAPEARRALDEAEVVLSKGQGNYESLAGQGRHVFYAFLCKCDLFTERFQVPRFTGMLIEERA